MRQVFISYKHDTEVDLFELLVDRLTQRNYQVWTDRNITPGEAWTRAIDNAIKESFAVIVIMTAEAHTSQYVTYEWSYALGAGKPIITLMVDSDVMLHPRLTEYQYSDFTKNKRPWNEILGGLERIERQLRETQQEQAFRWMQDGDSEIEHDDIVSALDSYSNAYNLADEKLRVRIGYKMARLYIRQEEKLPDDQRDKKAELLSKAEQLLSDALQARPGYSAGRAYLAYVYRRQRDVITGDDKKREVLEKARKNFREALENQQDLVDHNGESWWNTYGGVLKRLGDMNKKDDLETANKNYADAIDAYEKGAKYGKKSSYPYGNLAVLHMLRGDPNNMVKNYGRVEFYPPTDAGDFWSHGDQLVAYLIKGDLQKVERTFEQYNAFATHQARNTLAETLKSVANTLDTNKSQVINNFITRLEETSGD